jgi:hypothetical protein
MKKNHTFSLIIVVASLIICPVSLFAENGNIGPPNTGNNQPITKFDPNTLACPTDDLTCQTILFLWRNFDSLSQAQQDATRPKIEGYCPTWVCTPSTKGSDLSLRDPLGDGSKPFFFDDNDIGDDIKKDSKDLHQMNSDDLLALWAEIHELMEAWKKELQKLFSADWEDQDRMARALDQQWQDMINKLIQGTQNQEMFVSNDGTAYFVLDVVLFTDQIRAIHRLLNPPERLHPWLKRLLYLSRVTPEMLQFYQAALEERDRIYTLASKSDGRLKIRYDGNIMKFNYFPFPEDAEGRYELVYVRDQRVASNSTMPVAQAAALPPQ